LLAHPLHLPKVNRTTTLWLGVQLTPFNMLSHAQNLEDVMLYRALRHVDKGTWIDVGAWHPQLHSVTKWFYDIGWAGINVEPSRQFFRLLQRRRRRDINLNIAVGRAEGRVQFFQVGHTGLSSLEAGSVVRGRELGFRNSSVHEVEVRTMAQVFDEHGAGRDVHFVKIDVEGLEADVIAGFDFQRQRPWIIVVEAVEPITHVAAWTTWEPMLVKAGYEFVWFDGLNRFYLREESASLRCHFSVPVNVFDDVRMPYLRNAISTAELKVRSLFG
jgi:FkbM family methyltransferase